VVVTPNDYNQSLSYDAPPSDLSPPLEALWWAKRGDWDKAHRLVQDEASRPAAWVHAYLHRVEGDLGNARYWYGQARKPPASGDLDSEWKQMVEALLAAAP
jgi:hypothetical protein